MSTIPKRGGWVRLATETIRGICGKRCWRWNRPASRFWGSRRKQTFLRQPAPAGETSGERDTASQKESQVWQRQAQSIGAAPQGCEYIHVGDRGSDLFAFLRACQKQGCGFLVRIRHDRRVDVHVDQAEAASPSGARRHGKQRSAKAEPVRHLFEEVRSWPQMGQHT